MLRPALTSLIMLCAGASLADDRVLMQAEEQDAGARAQSELAERIRDLEAQQAATKAIAEKQQQLIEALEARIRALQEEQRERSDRKE